MFQSFYNTSFLLLLHLHSFPLLQCEVLSMRCSSSQNDPKWTSHMLQSFKKCCKISLYHWTSPLQNPNGLQFLPGLLLYLSLPSTGCSSGPLSNMEQLLNSSQRPHLAALSALLTKPCQIKQIHMLCLKKTYLQIKNNLTSKK